MKQFNLEQAKAGKAVCTRDERDVEIIKHDLKDNEQLPIVAVIKNSDGNEFVRCFSRDGKHNDNGILDLMMKAEKKEGWLNLYPGQTYNCKAVALNCAGNACIATIKIEWEE